MLPVLFDQNRHSIFIVSETKFYELRQIRHFFSNKVNENEILISTALSKTRKFETKDHYCCSESRKSAEKIFKVDFIYKGPT